MSNAVKITIVAVAAFVLGFLVARQLPPGGDGPEKRHLGWEADSNDIVLTPQTADKSYLVIGLGEASPPGSPPGTVTLEYAFGSTRVAAGTQAVSVHEMTPLLVCEKGECAPCGPKDYLRSRCGVPPPPCAPKCLDLKGLLLTAGSGSGATQ